MKRNRLLFILLALFAFGPTAWAQFGGGSGTEADPYIIHTTSHWNELVANVANGNTYEGAYFKQDAKIYPNTMVGTSEYHSQAFLTGQDPYVGSLRLPFSVVDLGSEDNPYLIASTEDWDALATQVANGQSYSGKYFRLGEDINVTTMVGTYTNTTDNKGFAGTFDGDGHTLTINVTNQGNRCAAPFKCVNGGTIKNLRVAGTISGTSGSESKLFGGIVGASLGNTTIRNCECSATVSTSFVDDGALGGLVGLQVNGTLNVEGCLFSGTLGGNGIKRCAGIVCYQYEGSCTISNTLFAPTAIQVSTSDSYARTLTRATNATIFRCYYTRTLGTAQGKRARSVTPGTNVRLDLTGDITEYNVSGISVNTYYDDENYRGFMKDGVIYAGLYDFILFSVEYTGSQTPTGDHQAPSFSATSGIFYSLWNVGRLWLDMDENAVINFDGFTLAFEGMGEKDDPFLIYCTEQWNLLCSEVNDGFSYSNNYFKLMADITVEETFSGQPTTQMGSTDDVFGDQCFSGIFNGNGHTITVNYTDNSNNHYCAPFRIIDGATITNLHVKGSIYKKNKKHAAGIVGKAYGICRIVSCRSSVDIRVNVEGDCSSGGLVGDVRTNPNNPNNSFVSIANCVFDGKLRSGDPPSTHWGGFVGWVYGWEQGSEYSSSTVVFNNCMFAPTYFNYGIVVDNNSKTFARGDGSIVLSNCYFTEGNEINGNQGKLAHTITAGEYVSVENAGNPSTTSTVGTIGYGTGIMYNDTLYAANGETISLNLNCTTVPGYAADNYVASAGTLSGSANPYSFVMPNSDVVISMVADEWEGTGTEDDPYLIYVFAQWDLLANRVNNPGTDEEAQQGYNGKFFKLMDDISVTTMVGNNQHSFRGTFDGNGHTLTVSMISMGSYCAPFRYVNDATIRHLHVAGTVGITRELTDMSSQPKYAGIVGRTTGTCSLIDCHSGISVESQISFGTLSEYYCGLGGFIGEVASGTVNMNSCVFDGRMISQRDVAIGWGGFIGWVGSNAHANITNCLFAPQEIQLTELDGSMTFARRSSANGVTITNSYYTQTLGGVQGKQLHSIVGDTNVLVAFAGEATENVVSGITTYANNKGFLYDNGTNSMLVAGNGDAAKLNLGIEGDQTAAAIYHASAGTLVGNDADGYTLTMPNDDVTITADLLTEDWEGDGTEETPYLIYSTDEWDLLATFVNKGHNYDSTYFRLMNSISVTTMVGTYTEDTLYNAFSGIFDGNGQTVTITVSNQSRFAAPFKCVDGATIRNLHTAGTIDGGSNGKLLAGIVGVSFGDTHIIGCISSASISTGSSSDAALAGIVAGYKSGDLTVEGCLFNGSMTANTSNPNRCGGMVGYRYGGQCHVSNSLFAPTELNVTTNDTQYSATFARINNNAQVTITNCYYTQVLGIAQGKQVRNIIAGENADFTMTFAGNATEYNVSGITGYSTGVKYNDVLYAGNGDNVSLDLTAPAGYVIVSATYTPEGGGTATEMVPVGGVYSFTMPDANVIINATLAPSVTQTVVLEAGQTWWSTNLDITLDDLKEAIKNVLGNTGTAMIKSQAGTITYNNGNWRGDGITTLDIKQMYKIQVSVDCEITLEGALVNPAEHPIIIVYGNNEIGFLPNESMSVTAAFAGFNPENGDVVKSPEGTTTYIGTRWRGTLETLVPGHGYIYQSKATVDKTFTYPAR